MDLHHDFPLNNSMATVNFRQSPEFSVQNSEPLESDLDFIQFNGPVPSATRATSKRHTPTIAPTEDLKQEHAFQPQQNNYQSKGDVFLNSDLERIEGVPYLDDEQ